jgi:hypothetical protein
MREEKQLLGKEEIEGGGTGERIPSKIEALVGSPSSTAKNRTILLPPRIC